MIQVLLAGAISVFAFSPYDYWWLIFPATVVLFCSWDASASAKTLFFKTWLYSFALFSVGLFWLKVSMLQFGHLPEWLATLLVLLFAAFVAIFPAFSGWLFARTRSSLPIFQALQMATYWTLMEWIRSWILSGFPWLSLGYSQTEGVLAPLASIMGVFGLTFVVVLLSALFVQVLRASLLHRLLSLAIIGAIAIALPTQFLQWAQPAGQPFTASLMQANIAQQDKWKPEQLASTLDWYQENTDDVAGDSQLVVWPETAIPIFLDRIDKPWLTPNAIRWQQQGTELLTGIVIGNEDGSYMNTLLKPGYQGSFYAKKHLVPFGEYVPFDFLFRPLVDAMGIPLANFSRGNSGSNLSIFSGKIQIGTSICYEGIFPSEVRKSMPHANVLVNVSNDAWFGDTEAPWQHLQMARMRAMENQRYMLRATNTGVSAVISPNGDIVASLGVNKEGVVTAKVTPLTGLTPYSRWGNMPVLVLLFSVLLLSLGLSWRRSLSS